LKFFKKKPKKDYTNVFKEIRDGDQLVRFWTDMYGEIYKIEVRKHDFVGYYNPDEFVRKLNIE